MAYIGRQLVNGNYLKLDDISSQFNGTTTRFNLTAGGSPFYPGSSYALRVALGGVLQEPEAAYTIDINQIVFATAPVASTEFYCVVLGTAIGINVPGESTVSGSKLTKPFNYDTGLLYLDDTNNRIGVNTESPQYALDVRSSGIGSTALYVDGNARITGILSVGQGTVTINGSTNTINIGTGTTISSSGNANYFGVVTASSFSGSGADLTGIVTSIVAGTNITVSGSTGQVTINATGGGGAALDILEVMLFA